MKLLNYSFSLVLVLILSLVITVEALAGGANRYPVTRSSAQNSYMVDYSATVLKSVGKNNFGQLGNGSSSNNPVGNLQTVVALTSSYYPNMGADHCIACSSSTTSVYVWGSNQYGQLGRSENAGTTTPHPTPILISLPGNKTVGSVAAGRYSSFAIDTDGKLWSWGYNKYGELGNTQGVGTENANFTPTEVAVVDSVVRWTNVVPGAHHTIVVGQMPSGQYRFYSFGRNNMGQLGRPQNVGTDTPNPVPAPVDISHTGSAAYAGSDFTFLFAANATILLSCGSNQFGQLGRNENSGTTNPNPTPVAIPNPSGATWNSLAAGGYHVLAFATDASSNYRLYTWGSNEFGQLGRNENSGTTLPNPEPVLIPLINNEIWISVAAGEYHSLVFTGDYSNPSMWACGLNDWGQLANPTNFGTMTPTPEWVVFGTPVSDFQQETGLPSEYSLEQNYPNPFNPNTIIKYSIPEEGYIRLVVYDLLGKEVSVLVNGLHKAGSYEVQFQAGNLTSGVYIYRIEATNYTASKKLMLMK
jgi:alpha-tubulin suppressor-like RCC1 family protein